jgi:hypothetical protein
MAERLLVILKRSGKTPAMAMCDQCYLKFFTPEELGLQARGGGSLPAREIQVARMRKGWPQSETARS